MNFYILYFNKLFFYTLCTVLQLELCSWYYFSQWLSALRPRYHPAHSGLSAKVLGKKLTRCDGDCCLFKCIPLHIHTHAHLGGSWSPSAPPPHNPLCPAASMNYLVCIALEWKLLENLISRFFLPAAKAFRLRVLRSLSKRLILKGPKWQMHFLVNK